MSITQEASGRRGIRNRAVEHNVAALSELSFMYATQRLVLRVAALI